MTAPSDATLAAAEKLLVILDEDFCVEVAARALDAFLAAGTAPLREEVEKVKQALHEETSENCLEDMDCPGKSDDADEWCRPCRHAWAIYEAGRWQARAEKAEAALKQSNLLLKAARIGPVKAVLAKSEGQTLMLTKKIADEIDAVLARGAE